MHQEITSHSVEETAKFAKEWLISLESNLAIATATTTATIVGLYGDLGSGKTTFTQSVARALGIEENVTSPTYVIEKIYELAGHASFSHLIHIDAYRLEKASELEHLGWRDILNDPKNFILIEWPERVAEIMPTGHIKIKFSAVDLTTRKIEVL